MQYGRYVKKSVKKATAMDIWAYQA